MRASVNGRFLGGENGEFADRKTGELVEWGRVWLWDDSDHKPVMVSAGREFDSAALAAWAKGQKFGDPVSMTVEVRSTNNGAKFYAVG